MPDNEGLGGNWQAFPLAGFTPTYREFCNSGNGPPVQIEEPMNKFALPALVLAGVVGLSAASPFVYAQATTPNATAPTQSQNVTPQRQRPLPGERIEARLAYIKTALKITPAQEPQWNALADVLRRQARDRDADIQQRRDARQNQSQAAAPTAIERLERQQEMLSKASARMSDLVTAAKPLYATFNDDQKKVADRMLDHGGRHFGHGRWH